MSKTVLDIITIFILILVSGVFVAAEMALVSLRNSQVKQLAHQGRRGQAVLLEPFLQNR